jgi:hypothetical protein
MTTSEIQAYAAERAKVAAEHARKVLAHCTPSQYGYPGMTAEQVIAESYRQWIEMDPDEIRQMMKRDEEMRECWRKQDENRAMMREYLDGVAKSGLKHPPAAEVVRRSLFGPRLDHLDEDLERCLKGAYAAPALAIVHEDGDSLTLQIELQDDRAVVISLSKHDGEAYTSVWTGSGEHELADNSLDSWRQWVEIATGKKPLSAA